MKVILAIIQLFAIPAFASDVQLAWDYPANTVASFTLYGHTNALYATNLAKATVRVDAGTNKTALIELMQPSGIWYFVVTATYGAESDPSNTLIVQVPPAPTNNRVVAIQYGVTITNFIDTGFFRLRIPAP